MHIDSELEPLTVYNYEVFPAMDNLVRHVLEVIPDSYTEEFPSFSVFERAYSPWDAYVEEEKVFCNPSLLDMPQDVAIGTLAHEFAHLFLRHTGEGGLREDYEADGLAHQWGFAEQIRAMRNIAGPPTLEQPSSG